MVNILTAGVMSKVINQHSAIPLKVPQMYIVTVFVALLRLEYEVVVEYGPCAYGLEQ